MPLMAANGITGAREMFSSIAWVDSTRTAIRRGELVGPRIVGSGHILDGSPPMLPGAVVARNAAEGRHAVDSLAAAGADFIKVYSRLTPDAFAGIADEARRRGIPFAGHVPSLVTVDEASAAGIASIEHLTGVVNACSPLPPAQAGLVAAAVAQKGWEASYVVSQSLDSLVYAHYDPAACRALARRLVRRGTVVVPTLVTLHAAAFLDDTTFAHDPRLRYVPKGLSAGWSPLTNPRLRAVSAADWANSHRQYGRLLQAARVLHENGVRFMAGTDLITPYTFAGFSLHQELELLTGVGFTPLQALQAATIEPARFLKMTDSLGTVAQGKTADLVVLDADPLADIRNVGRIHAVVLNGRLIDPAERERILRAAEAIAGGQAPAP
jgi:imidazolonepropionase-like amidohydrolase